MILHTLHRSPASSACHDCLAVVGPGDALLLLGDGVYAAATGTDALVRLVASGAELYLLEEDARAAGVTTAPDTVTLVDMDGFVALTERFPRQQAWY